MYIWRVNRLVEDLRADQVSEAESTKYLIFVAIICTISTDPVFAIGIEYSIFDALITLFCGVVHNVKRRHSAGVWIGFKVESKLELYSESSPASGSQLRLICSVQLR